MKRRLLELAGVLHRTDLLLEEEEEDLFGDEGDDDEGGDEGGDEGADLFGDAGGGEGGDELFAGYPTYQAMKLIKYYNIFPKELRVLIQKAAALLPVSHKNISFDFKIKQFLRGSGVSPEIAFILWMGSFSEIEKKTIAESGCMGFY